MIAYPRRCRLSLLFALAVLTTGQPISVDGFRPRAVAVQQQDGRRFKTAVALNKEEEASPPFPISRSQTACLQLRGGGVAGVIVTLLRTAVKNPVLILCTCLECL